ncbi:replication initiation protein [Methylobacterium sp. BTF04]|uniref:replication initiation protein n=1 Tax=Methylobacterium sp. BTF04 TaxID=2708300 RepID=UPI0013D0F192|nr:replication initiation protein [Methylobacterium sp. BTF04]NEU14825.1 replication initiation protein [Methylobacterium sp. BTF04]
MKKLRLKPFVPLVRGDLAVALGSGVAFAEVAPEAPRPASWLFDTTVVHIPDVTARDVAVFEFLVTMGLNADPGRQELGALRTCEVRSVLAMLEVGGRRVDVTELALSLFRLFGTDYDLKRKGVFQYRLPAWVQPLLQGTERYAHLDLATMARFKRRASSMLYRHVLGHVAKAWLKFAPGAEPYAIDMTPAQLAAVFGIPGDLHVGQMRLRHLEPALAEMAEHVTTFAVTLDEDKVGRAVKGFSLRVRMLPPTRMETAAVRLIDKGDFEFLHAHPDVPAYRVKASTLVKLGSALTSRILRAGPAGTKPKPLLNSEIHTLHRLWLVALHEAVTGEAVTPGMTDRAHRGASLLASIESKGPDRAFWAWAMDEVQNPDLVPAMENRFRDVAAADMARRHRWRAYEKERSNERRVALAGARREGDAAPAIPRRRKAGKSVRVVEAPITVEAPPGVQVRSLEDKISERDRIAREIQATPEAKAEANRLWKDLGLAFDFPFLHATTTIGRIHDRFAEDYPRLAEGDRAVLGMYCANLGALMKLSREQVPIEDDYSHYIAILARSPLVGIMNGKPGPVVEGIRNLWAIYVRDRKAADERRDEAARRSAGRYVRGQATSDTEDRDLAAAPIFNVVEMADIRRYALAGPPIKRHPSKAAPTTTPNAPTAFKKTV